MIATTAAVLALIVTAAAFAARHRWHQAMRTAFAACLVAALYTVALLVVSATASPRTLATGEWKCFDDWCVSLTSAVRSGDTVQVVLAVRNQGRRRQAPDTPRVWLVRRGRPERVVVPELSAPVAGGSTRELPPIQVTSTAAQRSLLLVTEGGFPSRLVIGDENSLLHPRLAWRLK